MQTATNPQTGQKVALVGGEWKPIERTATNPQGQKAFLIGGAWVQDDGTPTPQKRPIPKPAFEQEAEQLVSTTPAELIAGSAPGRFVLGAASPFIGAGQLVANAVGLGEPVNRHLQELERMKQRGAAAQPSPYQQNTNTGSGAVDATNR